MVQDNNNSERFKKFLQTLPEEKRKELFERLQAMSPEQRSITIDKLLAAYDEKNRAKAKQQKAHVSQEKRPDPPKPAPKPQKKPDNKKPAPRKSEPVKNKQQVKVKEQKTNKKSNKEIIAVILILFVFTGICLGIKILFDDKFDKIVEEAELKAQTSVASQSTETLTSDVTTATETTTVTEETTPTPSPTPTPIPVAAESPDLTGLTIVIDPGHQAERSATDEAVASWLSTVKPGATPGSVGVTSGIHEYELTLNVSLKLKSYLEQCGATVILTRETNDVDITNQERAKIATDNNANIFLRIHADAANDGKSTGVRVFVPDSGNYTGSNASWGDSLGQKVSEALGMEFIGTKATSLYTGLNYANTVPSFQISLGLLSNSDDEAKLLDENNQVKICEAISVFAGELKESGKV